MLLSNIPEGRLKRKGIVGKEDKSFWVGSIRISGSMVGTQSWNLDAVWSPCPAALQMWVQQLT